MVQVEISRAISFLFYGANCQVRSASGNLSFDGGAELFRRVEGELRNRKFGVDEFSSISDPFLGSREDSEKFFRYLIEKNILCESNLDSEEPDYTHQLYQRYSLFPDDSLVVSLKSIQKIAVDASGVLAEPIKAALKSSTYFQLVDSEQADCILYATATEGYEELLLADKVLAKWKKPYLFINIDRVSIYLGPLVIPEKTACFHCLEKRLFVNALYKKEARAISEFSKTLANSELSDAQTNICVGLVLNELTKLRTTPVSATVLGAQVKLDLDTYRSVRSEIVKVPKCEHCSTALKRPATAMRDAV